MQLKDIIENRNNIVFISRESRKLAIYRLRKEVSVHLSIERHPIAISQRQITCIGRMRQEAKLAARREKSKASVNQILRNVIVRGVSGESNERFKTSFAMKFCQPLRLDRSPNSVTIPGSFKALDIYPPLPFFFLHPNG